MRISSQQVFDSGVSSMQQHTSDVVKYQQQISSGRKYQVASDDALAAGLGVQIDLDNTQFAMFKVNQNHITASLTSTDSQLMNINLALTNFQQMVFDAVAANQFYIYSHPKSIGSVQVRMEDILLSRNPTDPFAHKPELGVDLRKALRA